ncbi:MAG: hypothetical protein V2I97_22715 [Desulfococcaceae bacterium]|jgi:hypothetical protein|nr:hypothetical protein [Desulfococcaceae bacterium]
MMLNTFNIYSELKTVLDDAAARKLAHLLGEMCEEIQNTVRKEDFSELKGVMKELAQAQKRTENRMEELAEAQKRTEIRVGELAEAQKRTEIRVEELTEAQKRTEIRVGELAEAQKRTEIRVEELAEAQKRTEIRVGELTEAQKRTEKSLKHLADEHTETRKQLGGIANTVGYRLEDLTYKYLPGLLQRDHRINLKERLIRKYLKDNKGRDLEINILGEGIRDGRSLMIVGESKSQLSKNDVDRFVKKRLLKLEGIFPDIFPVLVTYMISQPDAEEYAKGKGIAVYYSYDLA